LTSPKGRRDPDRHRDGDRRPAVAAEFALGDAAPDPLGDRHGAGEVGAGQHREQLVTAKARQHVHLAQAPPGDVGHPAQDAVAEHAPPRSFKAAR
jgi:hypothetical protein